MSERKIVEYHWVPGHENILGNEKADKAAKEAAAFSVRRGIRRLPPNEQFTTLSHIHRMTKETKTKETNKWLANTLGERQGYILPKQQKPDEIAMRALKPMAAKYYQLEIGHAIIGIHLKRINSMNDDRCWWCNSGDRQTVKHLFKVCTK
jgi:hypothetical protein